MKRLFLFLLLLLTLRAHAQTTFTGTVQDARGEAIIGANVYLKDTYDGTSSAIDGSFSFATPATGAQWLLVSAVGFRPYEQPIATNQDTVSVAIVLREAINKMDGVTITAGAFAASDEKQGLMLKPLEIVTTAGALGDISGALNTLPGTQTVAEDGRLFVRGEYTNLAPYQGLVKQDTDWKQAPVSGGGSMALRHKTSAQGILKLYGYAYDQYAVQAFRVNSVDYLLKPIGPDELGQALDKFWQYHQSAPAEPTVDVTMMTQIQQAISTMSQPYKHRFVVKVGEHIRPISVAEVLYFMSQDKVTFMQTRTDQKTAGRRFIIDYSLDQVEGAVDPNRFFRISRQYVVSLEAVEDIITYSSSHLKLILKHSEDNQVLVSRERVASFRQWLDQ